MWWPDSVFLDYSGRLEQYFLDCPNYTGDAWHQLLMFISYTPIFLYVFITVISFYDRSLFHVWLGTCCFVVELLVMACHYGLPRVHNRWANCPPHTYDVPAQGLAIVCAVVMIYVVYTLHERLPLGGLLVRFFWFAFLVSSNTVATYALRINNSREILMGAMLGTLTGAVFAAVLMLVLIPSWGKHWMKRTRAFMHTSKDTVR